MASTAAAAAVAAAATAVADDGGMYVGAADVARARANLNASALVQCTPLLLNAERVSPTLAAALPAGTQVHLKLDNVNVTGSFKVRGVINQLASLTDAQRACGVVSCSGGNYGVTLSTLARTMGIGVVMVMPTDVPPAKAAKIRALGVEVCLVPRAEVFAKVEALAAACQYTFLHPFDDVDLLAGYATYGTELYAELASLRAGAADGGGGATAGANSGGVLARVIGSADAVREPDVLVAGVGGGGYLSGICIGADLALNGDTAAPGAGGSGGDGSVRRLPRIHGVEPFGANAMYQSMKASKVCHLSAIDTICSGLAPPMAGVNTLRHCQRYLDADTPIVMVGDDAVRAALRVCFDELKIVAEPSGAASLAAVMCGAVPDLAGKSVVCFVSGGNVSLDALVAFLTPGGGKEAAAKQQQQ